MLGLEKTQADTGRAQNTVALLPPQVPKLPTGYRARDGIVEDIKCFLRGRDQNASQPRTLVAVGMGGSGKSVTAAAVVRDSDVREMFRKVCYIPVGQEPTVQGSSMYVFVEIPVL